MPGINMMPSGSTLQIPLDACTNFSGKAGNAQVTLTWTDPKDKYATPEGETAQDPDQLVSVWDHTVLVRKTGAQPAGPNDGTVVVSSSVRDQYASAGYVDTGLQNDTTYYYGVFAYNTDGVASPGAFASATPTAVTPLGSLAEGTLIKIQENGAPVEFYLAKHNYEPGLNGEGRELVVRKDVYDQRQWDIGGENTWASSAMRSWLNSTYKALLDSDIQELMGTTKYYYTPRGGYQPVSTRSDAVFLLSLTELNQFHSFVNIEGSVLPIAKTLSIAYLNRRPIGQWTRSPVADDSSSSGTLSANGHVELVDCEANRGSRPAFTLPSTAPVDQDLNLIETAAQTTALSAA